MRQEERRFVTYKIKQTLLNRNTGLLDSPLNWVENSQDLHDGITV